MADHEDVILLAAAAHLSVHHVDQRLHALLAAMGLASRDQLSFIVHLDERLDGEHRAHYGGGAGNASAPHQVIKVIGKHDMADVEAVSHHPVAYLCK